MKTVHYLLLLCSLLIISSCTSLKMGLATSKKVKRKVMVNETTQDTVVFLPMSHIAKPSFYESVKENVDSLRANNYIIFLEGIGIKDSLPINEELTYKKKLRKLLGFTLTSYQDSTNKSLPKAFANKKYIEQTTENTGIQTDVDLVIDLQMNQIIDKYENKYGEIPLSECDHSTALDQKYACEDLSNKSFYAIYIAREKHIMNEFKRHNLPKVVMIYGKAHWKFLYIDLYDLGYRLVEGKI